jgi:hypothetical protein
MTYAIERRQHDYLLDQPRQHPLREKRGRFLERGLAGDVLGEVNDEGRLAIDGENLVGLAIDGLEFNAGLDADEIAVPGRGFILLDQLQQDLAAAEPRASQRGRARGVVTAGSRPDRLLQTWP